MKNIFRIGQGAGDVLASIPYMKAMGGGLVVITKNLKNVPKWHPINHGGAEMLIPFVRSQGMECIVINEDSINKIKYTVDMDKRINTGWDGAKGDILTWNSLFYGVYPDMTQPFFEIEDDDCKIEGLNQDYILVTKTARYNNKRINYGFLNTLDMKKKFMGTEAEYELFKRTYGVHDIEHHKINDFMDAAYLIKNSNVFVSNQTGHYVLAEGLAHRRVLEICPTFPSVIPKTPNGKAVIYQHFFEEAIKGFIEVE